MKQFTVIGFWEDSRTHYTDHIEATDEQQAIAKVCAKQNYASELLIVEVIEGKHQGLMESDPYCACDDGAPVEQREWVKEVLA